MSDKDSRSDLNVTGTALVGLVGGILIFVFIVAVQVLFYWTERAEVQRKVVAQVPEELSQLRAQQLTRINTWRLADEQRKLAAIPIDQAMAAMARDPAAAMRTVRAALPAAPTTAPGPGAQPAGQGGTPQATQPVAQSPPTRPVAATQPGSAQP
jgi:hypothetical protein